MKYKISFELKSAIEDRRVGYDGEHEQTKISVTKVVEADTEKEALQQVIDLISDEGEE